MTARDLLLDTHAAVWWWTDLRQLSPAARQGMKDARSISVSAISALEVAIKYRIGKLDVLGDPAVNYDRLMQLNRFASIEIDGEDALRAGLMLGHHRDPFDRVIAAQALARDLTVVTCDAGVASFGCRVLW